MVVEMNGQKIPCVKAVKGPDYIKLYDDQGRQIGECTGVSDFTPYRAIGGEWELAERAEIEARKAPIEPTSEDILGVQVAQLTLGDMQKDQIINALGAQLARISLEIMNLRGSAL